MSDWISKKDLLAETGISYGQLYRWKRERLIPDSWFVKRASFTGQETFFPRERAIKRIRFILENKDRHTLQELLEMITPSLGSRRYKLRVLSDLPGAHRPATLLGKMAQAETFDHGQALSILIAAEILAQSELTDAALEAVLDAFSAWQLRMNLFQNPDGRFALLKADSTVLPLYLHPDSKIETAKNAKILYELNLGDLPGKFTPLLNQLQEKEMSQ